MERLNRREAIRKMTLGAAGVAAFGTSVVETKFRAPVAQAKDAGIEKIKEEAILYMDRTGQFPLMTGYRNSEVVELPDGTHTLLYQAVGLNRRKSGEFYLRPLADQLSGEGHDNLLASGKMGIFVPRRLQEDDLEKLSKMSFRDRAKRLKIPQSIQESVDGMRETLDAGDPTSLTRKTGPFRVTRFRNMVLQEDENDGQVYPVLIGDAAKQLKLIPLEFGLKEAAVEDIEFIAKRRLPYGGDIDQIIRWAAGEMGISESHARRIVYCESKFNPMALNPSGASGLWQIMPIHAHRFTKRGWDYWQDRFDPYKNSVVAVEIMQSSGTGAWSCK